MTALAMNLLLTGLWVLVTGDAGIVNAAVGYVFGLALLWWLWPRHHDRRYFRKLPVAVAFVAFLAKELLLSSLRVALDVIAPSRGRRRPSIVCVPLDVESDAAIALLANLVTMTPGSMALGVSADRRWMLVHAMFAPDDAALRREIKDGYERRVKELLA